MTRLTAMALAAAMALGAAPAASAATVLSASWTDACGSGSNCFSNGVHSQTFSAADFSGPVTVSQLLLDRAILGDLDGKTFRLSFQLNGEELGTWGRFTMGGIGGDALTMGGQAFTWNPNDGDLVLILEIYEPGRRGVAGGVASFAQGAPIEGGGGDLAKLPDFVDEGGGPAGDPGGRVTSPAPEPSAWALMITGFGGAGALLRRRRPGATAA